MDFQNSDTLVSARRNAAHSANLKTYKKSVISFIPFNLHIGPMHGKTESQLRAASSLLCVTLSARSNMLQLCNDEVVMHSYPAVCQPEISAPQVCVKLL